MSRNNNDRLGLGQPTSNAPVSVSQGLDFPDFSEFVVLPTKGKFYPPEHPLHQKESVEIRYLTTREEEILGNKSYIKENVVIDKLIKALVVDKRIDPETLFIGDKNAIMFASRATAYGREYSPSMMCPMCSSNIKPSFDLGELPLKEFSDDIRSDGTFDMVTADGKYTITLRLLSSQDEKSMEEETKKKQKYKIAETPMQDFLKRIIVSINNINDPFQLEKFIEKCPAKINTQIRQTYSAKVPNIDIKQNIQCPKCGSEVTVDIPFTVDFFWNK